MNDTLSSSRRSYALRITLVATLGGLLFGYDTAVISGTVGALQWYFITPRGLTEIAANSLLGFTVSSALIGCIIGGAIAGAMGNALGRKRALLIAAVLFMITSVGSALPELGFAPPGHGGSTVLVQFIVYRIIGGVGVGMASLLSPLYIAEIAPAEQRGTLVSFNQLAIIIGMLLVYFVNYGISLLGDDMWINTVGWRWMFGSETLPSLLFFLLLVLIPESPRWLMMKKHETAAIAILQRLGGGQRAADIGREIQESFARTSASLTSYGARVIVVGVALAIFQQVIGINVVMYYGPEIFKNLGSGTSSALLQTLIVGAVNFLFTIAAISSVDRFGRKPLQIAGALVMGVAMITLGFVFQASQLGLAALCCMLLFMAGFSFSWGPVVWVLLSEIFPNAIRGRAMSLAVAVMWIANMVVSWTFPMLDRSSFLTELFHHGFAYWVYGCMAFLAALFMWHWVPETKGKTLEEMEKVWERASVA